MAIVFILRRMALASLAGITMLAFAQTPNANPSASEIINALKPAKPKTRSLRNLGVQEAAPDTASDPAASVSPSASSNAASEPAQQVSSATPGQSNQPAPSAPPQRSIDLAVQFEFNSSKLSPAGRSTLSELATALVSPELEAMRFRIEGHTDSKGAAAYNKKLSEMRANEVTKYLMAHNVAAARLSAIGKGASEPLNTADPAAPENRRVRIVGLER